jgi:hypothetical protein
MPKLSGRFAAAIVLSATTGCAGLYQTFHNGAGYKAKALATGVFVSGREAERVIHDDLSDGPMVLVSGRVDREERSATARALGLVRSKAICREGLGCTLVEGLTEEEIRSQPCDRPQPRSIVEVPWPAATRRPRGRAVIDAKLRHADGSGPLLGEGRDPRAPAREGRALCQG